MPDHPDDRPQVSAQGVRDAVVFCIACGNVVLCLVVGLDDGRTLFIFLISLFVLAVFGFSAITSRAPRPVTRLSTDDRSAIPPRQRQIVAIACLVVTLVAAFLKGSLDSDVPLLVVPFLVFVLGRWGYGEQSRSVLIVTLFTAAIVIAANLS